MSKKKIVSKVQAKAKVIPTRPLPVVNTVKSVVKPVLKPTVKSSTKLVAKPVVKSLPKIAITKQETIKPALDKIDISTIKGAVVKTEVKKKKLAEVNSDHQHYFVYLKHPLDYRRQLLESSRKILLCLRSHQKIFLIRQKKLEEMNKLKVCVRELLYLNKKFNEKLPKYNTEFLEDAPSKDKSKPVNVKTNNKAPIKKPIIEAKPEKTEMDRLEESLANIEKKLRTLQ